MQPPDALAIGRRGTAPFRQRAQIAAGTERASGAGQQHGANGLLSRAPCDGPAKLSSQLVGQRVARFRPIEGDGGDAVAHRTQQFMGSGIAAPPITYQINGRQYVALLVGWGSAAASSGLSARLST